MPDLPFLSGNLILGLPDGFFESQNIFIDLLSVVHDQPGLHGFVSLKIPQDTLQGFQLYFDQFQGLVHLLYVILGVPELVEIDVFGFQHGFLDELLDLGRGIVGHDAPELSLEFPDLPGGQLQACHVHEFHHGLPLGHDRYPVGALEPLVIIGLHHPLFPVHILHLFHGGMFRRIPVGGHIIAGIGLQHHSQHKEILIQLVMVFQRDMAVHIRHPLRRPGIDPGAGVYQTAGVGGQRPPAAPHILGAGGFIEFHVPGKGIFHCVQDRGLPALVLPRNQSKIPPNGDLRIDKAVPVHQIYIRQRYLCHPATLLPYFSVFSILVSSRTLQAAYPAVFRNSFRAVPCSSAQSFSVEGFLKILRNPFQSKAS